MARVPNLLSKPRFWKKKVVLLTAETEYGVDPTLSSTTDWIEARNVALTSYDGTSVERNIEMPYFGNGGKVNGSTWSKLSFDIALVGSGTAGTAPKWGTILLGAAFSETVTLGTSAVYNLVSNNIGSLCAHLNIDGHLFKFAGARAEVKGKLTAKGIPLLTVELDCLYTEPVEADAPTIDRTGWAIEQAVNSVNTGKLTLNGVNLAFSELTWACGNVLTRVDLPGPQREVMLTDRKPSAACTVLAPALGVFNPYQLADAATLVAMSNTHGTVIGKKVKHDFKVVITNVAEDNVDGIAAYKLTLGVDPALGNDEIVLTCL